MVGNKLDLVQNHPNKREVTMEEAKIFSEENNILFKEASALGNLNVSAVFEELLESIYSKLIT